MAISMKRSVLLALLLLAGCDRPPQGEPPGPIRVQLLPISVDEARTQLPVPEGSRVLEPWSVREREASVTACVPGTPEAAAALVRDGLEHAGWPSIQVVIERDGSRLAGTRYPARMEGTATAGDRPECGADATLVHLAMRKGHETE